MTETSNFVYAIEHKEATPFKLPAVASIIDCLLMIEKIYIIIENSRGCI